MNNNQSPLVSVIMTAYNRENYIAEAIESVLASTYSNFELIIVDDCSKDNTLAIAKSYEKNDNRINVYVNEKNLKDYPNRNRAASYAKGKYVKYLDSDDAIYEWGLAYCVEIMEKFPGAGMAIFQAKNEIEEEYFPAGNAINKHFFDKPFLNIGPSGTILNRSAFEKLGYYNPDYGVPSDMFFNLKMASIYPVCMLKKEFFFYRTHEGQEIHNGYSYLYNNYPYLRDIMKLPEMPLTGKEKTQLLTKAKRDFLLHCIAYFKKTGNVKLILKAYKHSGIGLKDLLSGILNKPL